MRRTRLGFRMVSVFVALVLAAGLVPLLPVAVAAETDGTVWDGSTTDTAWWDNAPSANSFSISTAAEFAGLLKLSRDGQTFTGKTITLTADIVFNYF